MTDTNDTNDTREEGNTTTSSQRIKSKSKDFRSRKWCLTINNYEKNSVETMVENFDTNTQYIIGREIGENGTPHLQIYIEYKNARSFNSMKKNFPTAHIEKAKGTARQNYDYCSKEGKHISNMDVMTFREKMAAIALEEYKGVEWKEWQQDVLDLIDGKPDNRSIHWYFDRVGNIGKSYLTKYIALTRNVVICDGKKNDIYNQVNVCIENKKQPKIIILDIPRSSQDFVNYGVIEKLKDGMIYSGKYEGGVCIFPAPFVICFANHGPDKEQMSTDRWKIKEVMAGDPERSSRTPASSAAADSGASSTSSQAKLSPDSSFVDSENELDEETWDNYKV